MAAIASFLHFPLDTICSNFAFMSGLKRVATIAGKYITRLTLARPPCIRSLPRHFPDCLEIDARPASLAACLPLKCQSSGTPRPTVIFLKIMRGTVNIAQAITVAIPGTLVSMSSRAQFFVCFNYGITAFAT